MSNTVVNTVETTCVMRNSINQENNIMAFLNEYIPEADVEKYGLKEIDAKAPAVTVKSRDWTIDRERDIYLRQVSEQHIDTGDTRISWWTFYWKGELLWFLREGLGVKEGSDGLRHAHSRISKFVIPEQLVPYRDEIHRDLRDAFQTYGGGGVFSTSTNYVHDLEIAE